MNVDSRNEAEQQAENVDVLEESLRSGKMSEFLSFNDLDVLLDEIHNDHASTLNEMLIPPKGATPRTEEPSYDEDEMIMYRWSKLAGLNRGDDE